MAYGAQLIGTFEGQGEGVHWGNVNKGTSVDDAFTFGAVLGMMLFDGLIYGLLAWYIEGVWPGKYGVPRPFYFPFQVSLQTFRMHFVFAKAQKVGPIKRLLWLAFPLPLVFALDLPLWVTIKT